MNNLFKLSLLSGLFLTIASCDVATSALSNNQSASGEEMFIFETDNTYAVNASGINARGNSTTECQLACDSNEVAWGIDCTNVVALLSYGASDEAQDLPTTELVPTDKAIYSPDGVVIANDFADLIDDRDVAMTGNGFAVNNVYTGFDNGGATTFNCTDWTDTGAIGGNIAAVNTTGDWHATAGCGTTRPLLCLSWK